MIEQSKSRLRHELKYPLDFMDYQVLKKKLAIVLKPDIHAGHDDSYHVRSLYFDDFKNSALFEKQSGIARRRKYRIRIYNYSDDFIKFERKTKINHYVMKECVRLSREDTDKIVAGDIDFLVDSKNRLLNDFYLECRHNLLRPVVMVDYRREAYVYPIGNVRITFDFELHTNLGSLSLFDCDASTMKMDEENCIILEVKFDDCLPRHIKGLFPSTIRQQCALGKFAICRESTNALTGCSVARF